MNGEPLFRVSFFGTDSGRVPVREWLKGLDEADRKSIGRDIQFVQFRWPLGMPLVRKIEPYLWEVRSQLSSRRTARVLFTISDNKMVLLHGFIKKSQRISQTDLSIARQRKNLWQNRRTRHE
ncbi:MAG: type II toxin-antitoxin system RelE/ParE family toxin [Candidatus Poribacteria bacterium]|nr:type II toxin-antitoxin system RelE/ParE family toxin [Candidatus Poribacteria bacterium]